MVQAVVVKPLGELAKNLCTQVFGDVALVIDLADRLGDFHQLLVQHQEDAAFDGVGQHKVVDLCRVVLSVAVDAADALLHIHRVPRQVEVEQDARELQVDAFTASRRTNQHARAILLPEAALGCNLGTVITTTQHGHALAGECLVDLPRNQVHRAEVGGKHDDFFARVLPP